MPGAIPEKMLQMLIPEQFSALLDHPDFDYAVQGNLQDSRRSDLFFDRWERISALVD